jgi:hypothetical protein
VRCERVAVTDAAEQGAGDDPGALPQRAQLHGLAVELQDPAGVGAEALEVREVPEQRVVEATVHAARVLHVALTGVALAIRKCEEPPPCVLGVRRHLVLRVLRARHRLRVFLG